MGKRLPSRIKNKEGRPAFRFELISGRIFQERKKAKALDSLSQLFLVTGSYTNKSFGIAVKLDVKNDQYYYGPDWLFNDKHASLNFRPVPAIKVKTHPKSGEKIFPKVKIVTHDEDWRDSMAEFKKERKQQRDVQTGNYLQLVQDMVRMEGKQSALKDMVDILKRQLVAQGGRIEALEAGVTTKKTSTRPKKSK